MDDENDFPSDPPLATPSQLLRRSSASPDLFRETTQTPTPSTKPKPLAETQGDPVPTSQPTPAPTTPQLPTMMQEDPTPPSQPNSAPTTPQRHIRMQEDSPALSVPAPVTPHQLPAAHPPLIQKSPFASAPPRISLPPPPAAAASPNHRQRTLVNITPVLQAHLSMAQEHRRNTTIQTRTPNPSAFPTHTPRPINGFPETHLRHSAQLFDNMDQSAIATWDASEIINGIEYELQLHETQPDTKIAPPPLAQDAQSAPIAFLIYDISETTRDILLQTRIWATPKLTFEVFPFTPTFPTLMFLLDGFVTQDPSQVKYAVLNHWYADRVYDSFIAVITQDPDYPADLPPQDQLDWMANSYSRITDSLEIQLLDIRRCGNVPAPRHNIFATLPTKNPKTWHDLRTLFENIVYTDPLHGTGKKGPIRQCQICHCVTHPRGLCPFPNIEGWLGPKINNPPPL
ncbi:hypothetical protein JVT61DRAFT_9767 [Boletus reticuloceps]|uniref:Uncharacterized protein n=1 Tax=Boletus reticuloceps TaxID=495285 RepID=A0A8I2YG92_9AGAM|nr:hypothetical protein JVT61DRAFT_9767 [Boletus reticuloceps]